MGIGYTRRPRTYEPRLLVQQFSISKMLILPAEEPHSIGLNQPDRDLVNMILSARVYHAARTC